MSFGGVESLRVLNWSAAKKLDTDMMLYAKLISWVVPNYSIKNHGFHVLKA